MLQDAREPGRRYFETLTMTLAAVSLVLLVVLAVWSSR